MSERVDALPFKVWHDCIFDMIHTADFEWEDNRIILYGIREKLAHFEDKFPKLMDEVTTILELVLWKMKIYDNSLTENTTPHQKKIKTEELSIRQQCPVSCVADVVGHILLPFLITLHRQLIWFDEEDVGWTTKY